MLVKFLSRSLPAVIASFAVVALGGSAYATGNGGSRQVTITCPVEQNPVGVTQHSTGIQMFNVTGKNGVVFVKSIKGYDRTGAPILNIPTTTPFPGSFNRNLPAHSASVILTEQVFPATNTLASFVFDVQVTGSDVPFLIFAVHLDKFSDGSVASRAVEPCFQEW